MASDPFQALKPREKNFSFYIPNLEKKITPEIRRLLEEYSGIAPEDVFQHIHDIRDEAFAIRPYPCTGLGSFLDPMLPKSIAYPTIIQRLKDGDTFVDIGCFFGQDLRRLVIDGAPQSNLFGIDIVNQWDIGYKMFRDTHTFHAKFIQADVLHLSTEVNQLVGKVDIVSATHVLHQWDWEGQVAAAKEIGLLVRVGGIIVGFQVGTVGGLSKRHWSGGGKAHDWMKQDPESWGEMWELVGEATGTKWRVETAQLHQWEELGYDSKEVAYLGEDARLLQFVVTRVE